MIINELILEYLPILYFHIFLMFLLEFFIVSFLIFLFFDVINIKNFSIFVNIKIHAHMHALAKF